MISVYSERICCDPEKLPASLDLKIFAQEIRRSGKAAGLDILVESDQVTVGKSFGAKAEPCVAVYHAGHKKDYYSYVMFVQTRGNFHYLTTYLGGDSKNYRDTLLDNGGMVFNIMKSRAEARYAEEKLYYTAVREAIGEALANSVGRQPEPARPKATPKTESPKAEPKKTEPKKSAPKKAEPKAEPQVTPAAESKPSPKPAPKKTTKQKTAPKAAEPTVRSTEAEKPAKEEQSEKKYSLLAWITWLAMASLGPVFMGAPGFIIAALGIAALAGGQSNYNKGNTGLGIPLLIVGSFAACMGLLAFIPAAGAIVAIVALIFEFMNLNK